MPSITGKIRRADLRFAQRLATRSLSLPLVVRVARVEATAEREPDGVGYTKSPYPRSLGYASAHAPSPTRGEGNECVAPFSLIQKFPKNRPPQMRQLFLNC